ncbi:hypothetical protein N7486_004995 [Penicillium sp. IBT 16267x]|nr:hypothetical protein N7486_004995 [Penicillium sp. IBT 16267x]
MPLWTRLFSPRSAEETRGEGSENNDSVDLPSPSVPPIRRERARLQRRAGATAPPLSTKKIPPRGTRSSERIRNLQGRVSRALGISRSSARGSPEATSSPEASGSIPAPVFSSLAIEAPNTFLQSTAKDRSPELSAPSPTVSESSSSLLSPPDIIAQFKDENTSFPTKPLYSTPEYHLPPVGPSTPAVSESSSPLLSSPDIIAQFKDENTSFPTKPLYSTPEYHLPPTGPSTPAVQKPSSPLLSPPDIIAQFKDENTSSPTKPLYSNPQYHLPPIRPSTPAMQKPSSSPLNPPSITPHLKNENTSSATRYLYSIPQYNSSPVGITTPAVPQSTSSLFSSSPIRTPTAAAATKYLYSIPQYYSDPIETTTPVMPKSTSFLGSPGIITQSQGVKTSAATTTPAVPQSTSSPLNSPLSSPSSIAQCQDGKDSVPPSPQYHSFPIGTPIAADMPKSRKRKSSNIDLEPPRTPKRRSPGIQKHDLNTTKQSTPPSPHSGLHEKRKRDKLDEEPVCSAVAESLNEDPTSSESSQSLYSDDGSGDDSEHNSFHDRCRPEPPSPSPSAPKRAKPNPKLQVNRKKQAGHPRSVETKAKAPAGQKRPNTKGTEKSHDNEERYVDVGQSDESDYQITSAERNDLLYELTRERASRMAEAVEIPPDSGLGPVQVKLIRKLATRGCKPVMSRFWASDFTTWPEALFTSISDGDSDSANGDGEHLMFRSQNMSDNYAIKALQELFAVSGRVRDCSLLSVEPQFVVGKAIREYLHWAIDDAGLKTTGQTVPVHCICPQIPGEEIFATIMRCSRKLERLGKRHQMAHAGQEAFWPTMIGFVIAGPIVCLLSLDTDPDSEVWSTNDSSDEDSPAKFLTQFDLSEREQDVWNSLAVAICVIHLRDTLIELARTYPGSRAVPLIRGLGDETDDEDL